MLPDQEYLQQFLDIVAVFAERLNLLLANTVLYPSTDPEIHSTYFQHYYL